MSHVWQFYGLNKYVDLPQLGEVRLSELEELLGGSVNYESWEIEDGYTRIELDQEVESAQCRFIIVGSSSRSLKVPNIVAFSGDSELNNSCHLLLEWLRAELTAFTWPLSISPSLIIDLCDAAIRVGHSSDERRWFNSKFIFNITTTQNDNLKRIEMRISKENCKEIFCGVGDNSKAPFKDVILPTIYNETGMKFDRMPLHIISLAGYMKISPNRIATAQHTIKNQMLITFLHAIQI